MPLNHEQNEQLKAYRSRLAELEAKGAKLSPEPVSIESLNKRLNELEAKGTAPDHAVPSDLYGDTLTRMKAGFADPTHHAQMLMLKGYKNPHQRKEGHWVALHKNGKWVRDADSLISHPINSMASGVKHVAPLAGMAIGGLGGSAVGVPTTVGALATGVGGAALGRATGQEFNHGVGRALGVYGHDFASPENLENLKNAGIQGATDEFGGQVIGKLPIGKLSKHLPETVEKGFANVGENLIDLGRKGTAKIASFMNGVDKESVLRLLRNPTGVNKANPLATAKKLGQSLHETKSALGQVKGHAATEYLNNLGKDYRDTAQILKETWEELDHATAQGLLPKADNQAIKDWMYEHLYTMVHKPGEQLSLFPKSLDHPSFPKKLPKVQNKNLLDLIGNELSKEQLNRRYFENQGNLVTTTNPLQQHFSRLRGRLDKLMRSTPDKTGQIAKEAKNLGNANTAYAKLSKQMKVVKAGDTPGMRENFVRGLNNRGKAEQREIVETHAPHIQNEAKDAAAKEAWDDAIEGSHSQMGHATRLGLAAFGLNEARHHNLSTMAGVLGLGVLSSPSLQKKALTMGAHAVNTPWAALKKYKQVTPSLMGAADRNPWSLWNKEEEEKNGRK